MKAAILAALSAVALNAATSSAEEAGSWTTRWTGPAGGVYQGSGGCNNGACQSAGTFTGPNGGVWHHAGNAHMVGPGAMGRRWLGDWAGRADLAAPMDLAALRI